ncbi:MAG: hypothetical protein QXE81_06285 [Desulfurococcaceae archaeon]
MYNLKSIGYVMAIYKPGKDRKKAIEDALRDLDPSIREMAIAVLENIIQEERAEISREDLAKLIAKIKKQRAHRVYKATN